MVCPRMVCSFCLNPHYFQKIGTLEEIALPQNGITAMGIGALATCFKSNPNLRVINLNDNTATQLGSEAIAKVVYSSLI